jgi:hypothetical protein
VSKVQELANAKDPAALPLVDRIRESNNALSIDTSKPFTLRSGREMPQMPPIPGIANMTIENFTTDIAEMDVEEMAEEFYTKFGNTSFAEELANGTFDMTFEEDLENFKQCCEWLEQYAAEETAFAAAEQAREKYEDMDPTTYSDIFDEPSTFEEA